MFCLGTLMLVWAQARVVDDDEWWDERGHMALASLTMLAGSFYLS